MPSIEVFFSYAREDEDLRNKLAKHLTILKRQGVITTWHNRNITAGVEWANQIDQRLERAQVILLLVSTDFWRRTIAMMWNFGRRWSANCAVSNVGACESTGGLFLSKPLQGQR